MAHPVIAEVNLVDESEKKQNDSKNFGKMGRKLAKHADSVEKLHAELSSKIAARHSELWQHLI